MADHERREQIGWLSLDLSEKAGEFAELIKDSALARQAFADWLYPEHYYEAERKIAIERILSAEGNGDKRAALDWGSRLRIVEQRIAIRLEQSDRRKAQEPEYAEAHFQVTSDLDDLRTLCREEAEREAKGASEGVIQEKSEQLYNRFVQSFAEDFLLF